jgi:membrane protein implicated in regulation of membrane protease activity
MTILWWHWLVFGLLLALGEVVTPGGFYILFFGIAAIAVGLLAGVNLAGPSWMQLLLFSILSVGSLLLFRTRLLRWMQVDPQLPAVDALVGEVAVAAGELGPGVIGKVELRGSSWSARNVSDRPIPAHARCRVVRVDGLMVDVTPEGAR